MEQTRDRYRDGYGVPAVHPRYRASYNDLYGEEVPREHSTFGIRLFLSLLLFAAFITLDRENQTVFHMDSQQIVQQIADTWVLK